MYLYAPTSDSEPSSDGCVVALGCFDGLHVGHLALLARARAEADKRGLPLVLYSPEARKGQAYLTTPEEKTHLLYAFGADRVILADFDAIKDLSAESFVSEILCAQLSCRCALCGYNFRFGKYAAGSSDTLGQLLQAHGADTVVLPAVKSKGEDVSSTRIRALIQCGRIEDANDLLCKPFSVMGTVSKGRQIGRTLGFPTANLPFPMGKLIPRNGVYYCHVKTRLGIFGAVANIGIHPTFDDQPERPVLEAHLLSFDGDLYGEEVQVSLLRFLREEKKFSDPAVLAATVHADMHTAMQLAATDPILMKGSS
ncbi:MAG: riboflavin biosynthesis protein RibF [Ruminococcaceae bacterium]|nr:riboflavin biosynthesis protein RibF [Oscillospiraceae bacterium]